MIAKRPSMLTTYTLFVINKWFHPDRQRQTDRKIDRQRYIRAYNLGIYCPSGEHQLILCYSKCLDRQVTVNWFQHTSASALPIQGLRTAYRHISTAYLKACLVVSTIPLSLLYCRSCYKEKSVRKLHFLQTFFFFFRLSRNGWLGSVMVKGVGHTTQWL